MKTDSGRDAFTFTIIVPSEAARRPGRWQETLRTAASQLFTRGTVETIICKWNGIRGINGAVTQSRGEVLVIIEEPLTLPPDLLQVFSEIFTDSVIDAVQPRIISRHEAPKSNPFASRAGFIRLFRVPVLDGRICAVRRSAFDRVGPLSDRCGKLAWPDFSWRLLFSPALIHATSRVTAICDEEYRSFTSALAANAKLGFNHAAFLARWRAVLKPRLKRICYRSIAQAKTRSRHIGTRLFTRESGRIARELSCELVRCFFAVLGLPFELALTGRVVIVRSGNELLYPWSFFFSDDHGFYGSRIALSDQAYLYGPVKTLIRVLLTTRFRTEFETQASRAMAHPAPREAFEDTMRVLVAGDFITEAARQ